MTAPARWISLALLPLAANGCWIWRRPEPIVVMTATALIHNKAGAEVGRARLLTVTTGVEISGSISGLSPGMHGIHVHTLGSCSPDFGAAGPHWNPEGRQHGLRNPLGPHGGDMPNLVVPASGSATFDIVVPNATIRSGDRSMLDGDGASIVVHALPDDYLTDPSGNSGERIACGVIVPN